MSPLASRAHGSHSLFQLVARAVRSSPPTSAGLAGLHTLAMLLRGEKLADPEAGWQVFKSMDRSRSSGMQKHVKLLSPQQGVADTFDKAGFTLFFEIYTDLKKAVASF